MRRFVSAQEKNERREKVFATEFLSPLERLAVHKEKEAIYRCTHDSFCVIGAKLVNGDWCM